MTARLAELMTEDEAAQRLRLCARTLRKARKDGHLTFVRFGKAARYAESDLAQFIESKRECHSIAATARAGGE